MSNKNKNLLSTSKSTALFFSGFIKKICAATILGILLPSLVAFADSVAQIQNSVFLAPESVQMLKDRVAAASTPGLAVGDIYSYIVQFTPVANGGTVGQGGYVTMYVPSGSQVVGAQILNKNSDGTFVQVGAALPGPSPDGWGSSRGQITYTVSPWTTAFNALCTTFGQALGKCNGSIAQIFADTGIFYSTDSRTAVYFSPDTDGIIRQSTNGYNIKPTGSNQLFPILGITNATTHNLWDASHINAFGSIQSAINALAAPKSPAAAIDASGVGATPFGSGSAVAGPDSGYKLDYSNAVGPWHRIAYPGSRVGTDTIGPAVSANASGAATANAVAIDGSDTTAGYALSAANPLPVSTNAVRFAMGRLTVGQVRYVKVSFKVTATPPVGGIIVNAEVFGGDIASFGSTVGKDNASRYAIPTVNYGNSNLFVSKEIVKVNGANYLGGQIPANALLRYRLTYLNTSPIPQTNVILKDTLPSQTAAGSTSSFTVISGPNILPISPASPTAGGTFTFQTIATLGPGLGGSVEYNVQTTGASGNIVTNKGTIQSTETPSPIPGLSVATVGNTALLGVEKTVSPSSVLPGANVTYTIKVTNNGDAATSATNPIVVNDFLPTSGGSGATPRFNFVTGSSVFTGITGVTPTVISPPTVIPFNTQNMQQVAWSFGSQTLAAGASFTIQFQATVGSAVPLSTSPYLNSTEVTYNDQSVSNEADAIDVAPVLVTNQTADLSLTKSVSNASPHEGDNVTYTLTLNNAGPNDATNVTVGDTLPSGVTYVSSNASLGSYLNNVWTVGTIANGSSATLQITVKIKASTAGNTISNTAQISHSDITDPNPGNNQSTSSLTVAGVADLALTQSISSPTAHEGDTVTYTLTLKNNGPNGTTNVTVGDTLPTGLTYVSSTPSVGTFVGNVWTVGSLANNQTVSLQITATVDAGIAPATLTNTAEVTQSDQLDPNSTPNNNVPAENDQASVDLGVVANTVTISQADLSLTNTVDHPNANEHDTVVYTVTVTNNGPDDATTVTVGDTLPAGVTYVSSTPSVGTYSGNVWNVGALANGASQTLQITATINAGTAGTTLSNTAEVAHSDQVDPNSTPNNNAPTENDQAKADVTVAAIPVADLALTQTVDHPTVNEGDTVTFTLTLNNIGPNNATNVTVGDTLPSGLHYVSSVPSVGGYAANVWTVGSLASGASETLQISATTDAGTGGSTLSNVAEVASSDQLDPNSTPNNGVSIENDQASASLDVNKVNADLQIVTTVSNPTPKEGDTIDYILTVTDNGPGNATGVGVLDVLPSTVTFVSATPSQGTYDDSDGDWALGNIGLNQTQTLDIKVTVNNGTAGTNISNPTAIFELDQIDPVLTNNNSTADIHVQAPVIVFVPPTSPSPTLPPIYTQEYVPSKFIPHPNRLYPPPKKDDLHCLDYNASRTLDFKDLNSSEAKIQDITNILKGTFLSEKLGYNGQQQYIVSGYSSFTNDTGSKTIQLDNNITRLEWAKTLMTSHCLQIMDVGKIPAANLYGQTISKFLDLPMKHTGDHNKDWISDVMYSAKYYGILDGTRESNAESTRYIDVAEAVKMIMRAGQAKSIVPHLEASESKSGQKWYLKYYSQAASEGILVNPLGINLNLQVQSLLSRKDAFAFLLSAIVERGMYSASDTNFINQKLQIK